MASEQVLTLRVNEKPFLLLIEVLQSALEARKLRLNVGDLPAEIGRVEVNHSATSAGELTMTVYPSDALLDFAAAVLAGQLDLTIVKHS